MTGKLANRLFICLSLIALPQLPATAETEGKQTVIKGVVLDSACLFTKGLNRPISRQCALECAAGGSPLVILTSDGNVYWPIDSKMPAQGQNFRLIKAAGRPVKISGTVYERGSSKAIVMDTIEESEDK